MSLFTPQFQIISDLHLETPIVRPQYSTFKLQIQANNLCLLGDIGLVKDAGFFHFLRRLLEEGRGYRIFYVIGNHESYQMAFKDAVSKLRSFEKEAERDYGGRFILLHRGRYNIDKRITVLGCTLWTAIDSSQASEVASRLTDFNEHRGIRGWSLSDHLEEHRKDLSWLNDQVIEIQRTEPQREIVILTHHCPTIQEKATDPTHRGSPVSSGFTSDLSNEVCWIAPEVKVWAFGHTHYDCAFHDQQTGKLVLAHQKGYSQIGKMKKVTCGVVVEPAGELWKLVDTKATIPLSDIRDTTDDMKQGGSQQVVLEPSGGQSPKKSLLNRAGAKFFKGFR